MGLIEMYSHMWHRNGLGKLATIMQLTGMLSLLVGFACFNYDMIFWVCMILTNVLSLSSIPVTNRSYKR